MEPGRSLTPGDKIISRQERGRDRDKGRKVTRVDSYGWVGEGEMVETCRCVGLREEEMFLFSRFKQENKRRIF